MACSLAPSDPLCYLVTSCVFTSFLTDFNQLLKTEFKIKNCVQKKIAEKCTQFFPLSRPHRKGVHEKSKIGKFRKTSKNIFGTLDFFHEHNALFAILHASKSN
jgi:hypothetical protein